MTERRLPIILIVLALLVAIAVAVVSCHPTAVLATRRRQLAGPGSAASFAWTSSDHTPPVERTAPPVQPPSPSVPFPSDVTFGIGSATLADPAAVDAVLMPIAAAAVSDGRVRLTVDAHASADGDDARNLELSLHRGEAIRARLVAAGVAIDRVQVVAHGEADLPDPSNPESPENRVVTVSALVTEGEG